MAVTIIVSWTTGNLYVARWWMFYSRRDFDRFVHSDLSWSILVRLKGIPGLFSVGIALGLSQRIMVLFSEFLSTVADPAAKAIPE